MKQRSAAEILVWYRNWFNADLSYILRPDGQRRLDEFIEECHARDPGSARPVAIECHRRLGKSFNAIRRAVQRCLRAPRTIAKIGAPTKELAREIVELDLGDLLEDCPPEFLPRSSGNRFYWRNPAWKSGKESMMVVVGLDHKRGNLMRGTGMDFCALDEAGQVENLAYIMQSVIAPQFDRTSDPEYLIMSTPPPSMDHHFVCPNGVIAKAQEYDRHICIPGSENSDFTGGEKKKFLEASGIDEESVEYRREIECKHISDESRLIVPRFAEVKEMTIQPHERPARFRPWVSMDTAWNDYTAVLFAYLDYERQLIVIEDMIWEHYMTTQTLAGLFREKVEKLYPAGTRKLLTEKSHVDEVRRIRFDFNSKSHAGCVNLAPEETERWDDAWRDEIWNDGLVMIADMPLEKLEDLARDYALFFEPAKKFDKFSRVASFRRTVERGQWRINPETCGPLIYQLENGLLNEKRSDFERSNTVGHCDAIAAGVYLNAMMYWEDNPFPPAPRDFENEWYSGPHVSTYEADAFKQAFGG